MTLRPSPGLASALAVIRVPRGAPRPSDAEQRAVLEGDRRQLGLPPETYQRDCIIAGPYAVSIEGEALDEYVVWEC